MAAVQPFRGSVTNSNKMHADLLADAQRLRGRIYVEDGALAPSDLTADGRHVSAVDQDSWHLLAIANSGSVMGCTRFRQHSGTVRARELCVSRIPLASSKRWARGFRASLEAELDHARSTGFSYVEVGGWALDQRARKTPAALSSVLATYAWSRLQGGALGISTATRRNGSASILRKLGGRPLEWDGAALPPYYDPTYKCTMEVLRFDSRRPNPKYAFMIQQLANHISTLPVVRPGRAAEYAARPSYGRCSPAFSGFQANVAAA